VIPTLAKERRGGAASAGVSLGLHASRLLLRRLKSENTVEDRLLAVRRVGTLSVRRRSENLLLFVYPTQLALSEAVTCEPITAQPKDLACTGPVPVGARSLPSPERRLQSGWRRREE